MFDILHAIDICAYYYIVWSFFVILKQSSSCCFSVSLASERNMKKGNTNKNDK